MFGIGTEELIVILLLVLVLTGGKKIPELSRGLGEAMKEIRKGIAELNSDNEKSEKTETKSKKTKKNS